MEKTVWKDRGKKWSPRNKQAALIFTKAKPFHLPIQTPIIVETRKQQVERENRERSARVEAIKIEERKRHEAQEKKRAFQKKESWKKRMKRFHKKQTRKLERVAKKIAAKLGKTQS